MATKIKIGHASISDQGTANGLYAGDQDGNEVCIDENFSMTSLNPHIVLRPKTATLAALSAKACEAGCSNARIGYSQNRRNTLYTQANKVGYDLSKVNENCDTDCSAFMTVCAIAGGARISYGTNAPTTSNMRTRFKQSGDYTVLTDSKHTTITDYLKRGDILVREGSHTVMVLENGRAYKDEIGDFESSTEGITLIRKIRTYSLALSITNIKATSAVVKFSVIEVLNNVEKTLTNTNKWTYYLSVKAIPSLEVTKHTFSKNELSLTGLAADSSYMVQVSAVNATGDVAFCSAPRVFTTEPEKTSSSKPLKIEFGNKTLDKSLKLIDKTYIKTQSGFKQAIIYDNIQEV
jgi:hypothetical protein